jgi:hypothetical protein
MLTGDVSRIYKIMTTILSLATFGEPPQFRDLPEQRSMNTRNTGLFIQTCYLLQSKMLFRSYVSWGRSLSGLTLCIIQDEESDKLSFIPNMDSIYGCAMITIVAASGTDAQSGLPGVKSRSARQVRVPFTINGVSLLETCDTPGWPDTRLNSRAAQPQWATRGWTFQERLVFEKDFDFQARASLLGMWERNMVRRRILGVK